GHAAARDAVPAGGLRGRPDPARGRKDVSAGGGRRLAPLHPGTAERRQGGVDRIVSAPAVTWDLGGLYADADDPRLDADMDAALEAAPAFDPRHRGRVAALSAEALAAAIAEYEAIDERSRRPAFYASLRFAADTQDERSKRLADRTREAAMRVTN